MGRKFTPRRPSIQRHSLLELLLVTSIQKGRRPEGRNRCASVDFTFRDQ
jgi:hypothetical protein